MPQLSSFFGSAIYRYYEDHPPPHFHVRYNTQRAILDVGTPGVLRGRLSPRLLGLVTEWAAAHQDELLANWELARSHQALLPIVPLE